MLSNKRDIFLCLVLKRGSDPPFLDTLSFFSIFHFSDFDPGKLENSSYLTLAKNLFHFKALKGLPLSIEKSINSYQNFNSLAHELSSNNAFYHKNCYSKYNQTHLQRLSSSQGSASSNVEERTARRSISAHNIVDKCFICDEKDGNETLHECRTLYLDARVRKIALEMQITKLISKLSEGDMVATEAKYHRNCSLKLYNNYRNLNKEKFTNQYKEEFIVGLALSKVIYFIKENVRNSVVSPVFLLKDLKCMYEQKLTDHGYSKNIHSTRFKERLLESIPGLCENKKGRNILLSLEM